MTLIADRFSHGSQCSYRQGEACCRAGAAADLRPSGSKSQTLPALRSSSGLSSRVELT